MANSVLAVSPEGTYSLMGPDGETAVSQTAQANNFGKGASQNKQPMAPSPISDEKLPPYVTLFLNALGFVSLLCGLADVTGLSNVGDIQLRFPSKLFDLYSRFRHLRNGLAQAERYARDQYEKAVLKFVKGKKEDLPDPLKYLRKGFDKYCTDLLGILPATTADVDGTMALARQSLVYLDKTLKRLVAAEVVHKKKNAATSERKASQERGNFITKVLRQVRDDIGNLTFRARHACFDAFRRFSEVAFDYRNNLNQVVGHGGAMTGISLFDRTPKQMTNALKDSQIARSIRNVLREHLTAMTGDAQPTVLATVSEPGLQKSKVDLGKIHGRISQAPQVSGLHTPLYKFSYATGKTSSAGGIVGARARYGVVTARHKISQKKGDTTCPVCLLGSIMTVYPTASLNIEARTGDFVFKTKDPIIVKDPQFGSRPLARCTNNACALTLRPVPAPAAPAANPAVPAPGPLAVPSARSAEELVTFGRTSSGLRALLPSSAIAVSAFRKVFLPATFGALNAPEFSWLKITGTTLASRVPINRPGIPH